MDNEEFAASAKAAPPVPAGAYLKMPDAGDTHEIVIGSPIWYEWNDFDTQRFGLPWGEGKCQFAFLVYVLDTRQWAWFRLPLAHFHDVVDPLVAGGVERVYRITRLGVSKQTKYKVGPVSTPVPQLPAKPSIDGFIEGAYRCAPTTKTAEIPF